VTGGRTPWYRRFDPQAVRRRTLPPHPSRSGRSPPALDSPERLFKQTDIAEKALGQWGADRFFQTPVDLEELVAEVDALIAERPLDLPNIPQESRQREVEIEVVPGSEAEVVEEPEIDLEALLPKPSMIFRPKTWSIARHAWPSSTRK
jgi:hypothetical protein